MSGASGRDLEVVVVADAIVALTADGPLAEASTLRRGQRGEGVVAAVQAARLGAQVALVTRVGDDALGDWLLEGWEAEGLHLDFARRCRGRNALELRSAADGPRRTIAYREASVAAALDRGDVEPVPWDRTRVVYTTGATQALSASARAAVAHAFALARAAGARTVYAPTVRAGAWGDAGDAGARAAFDELAPLTDVLIIDAPLATGKLTGRADATEAARALTRDTVRAALVRDPQGACVAAEHGDVTRLAPTLAVAPSQDPLWAHGSFAGAALAALACGASVVEAARGALIAMAAATRADATGFDRLPTRRMLEAP